MVKVLFLHIERRWLQLNTSGDNSVEGDLVKVDRLSGEKDIGEIAEEEGIQYESAAQRGRRAKVKIKVQMEIKKTAIVPVLVKKTRDFPLR